MGEELLERYQRDGFAVVENAVDKGTLDALRAVTDDLIAASSTVTESNSVYDLDAGHSANTPRLTRIKLPHLQHDLYWQTLVSANVLGVLQQLLGTSDVRLHTSKLNCKAPQGGRAVEWHQDWAFYPHTNDDILALGIWLDDVTDENGPLMAIPGSHTGPVLNHRHNGVFAGAVNPGDTAFDLTEAVAMTGRAGSASVHHVRTLHGSAPNTSIQSRRVLFFECCAADAWPLAGIAGPYNGMSQDTIYHDLQARIICGQLPMQARLSAVPVDMPLPVPPDSSSIFKVQESGGAPSAFGSPDAD